MGSEKEALRVNAEDGRQKSRVDVAKGPPESHVLRCVEGMGMEDFVVVLQRCSIGWCRFPISNSCLVKEICLEEISGVHVMRLAGSRVLLIFDSVEVRQQVMHSGVLDRWFSRVVEWSAEDSVLECRRVWVSVFGVPVHTWSRDNFEHLVSHCGLVILIEEDTLEPSSFERGRVLIETTAIDRIEEHVEFSVGGRVFPVRISKSDTLLRGPRGCRTTNNSSSSGESVSTDKEEQSEREFDRGQQMFWEVASDALKPVAREDQLVDVAVDWVGPVVEDSNIETSEEKQQADKAEQRRGRGRLQRRRCVGNKRGMASFVSFVEEAGFLDLLTPGKAFTWFGIGLRASRLDRFLVSPPWVEHFRGLDQFILQWGISDHAPV
ncbi:hypothetical protein V6N13_074744 [Hibiscus sabdariffa]